MSRLWITKRWQVYCNRSIYTHCMQSQILSSFLQWHLAMKTSLFLLLASALLFLYRVEVATLVLTSIEIDRSIDRSINRSVVIKAPYALTTKSDLGFFPVTSSDEDITIFRGYYCKYQLAERPLRQGIICETSGKRTSQTSKQKHNRAKHFGWHWRFKNRFSGVFSKFSQNCPSRPATRQFVKTLKIQVKIYP